MTMIDEWTASLGNGSEEDTIEVLCTNEDRNPYIHVTVHPAKDKGEEMVTITIKGNDARAFAAMLTEAADRVDRMHPAEE